MTIETHRLSFSVCFPTTVWCASSHSRRSAYKRSGSSGSSCGHRSVHIFSPSAEGDRSVVYVRFNLSEGLAIPSGDVAHGERPDLDASGWQTIKTPFEAPKEAFWLRRWIEVPKNLNGYDVSGSQIWFHITASANGPVPMILYYNGSRVALGSDLEDQVLFNQAKPGDKILVAVKFMETQDGKYIPNPDVRIVLPSDRPNPGDFCKELQSAAAIFPAVTHVADTLDAEQKALDAAATTVDLTALDKGDQAAFDASLRHAQTKLETLRPALQQYTVHMTGNAHIDAAWLWPWTETVDVVKRTFSTALQLMDEYPDYTYTQSAAQYYEWMQDKYPDLFNRFNSG